MTSILIIIFLLIITVILFFLVDKNNKDAVKFNRNQEVQIRLLASIALKHGVPEEEVNALLKGKRRKEALKKENMNEE